MDYTKLSKQMSYILRHSPHEYGLELNDEGWVLLDDLISALKQIEAYVHLKHENILEMMAQSDKKRFEIKDGTIRALYGHSTEKKIVRQPSKPPQALFHGTAKRFANKIMKDGLLPKGRQYVHLSEDKETAIIVGKRRDNSPVLLKINAEQAYEEGVLFYFGNDSTWLVDYLLPKYIELCEQ